MTKPANTEAIAASTGISWTEWVAYLDAEGGRESTHRDIVRLALGRIEDRVDKPGWWAQGVAVAYGQHIGWRLPGQDSTGTFQVSVTRTAPLPREDAFDAVLRWGSETASLDGVQLEGEPRTSVTPKRSYWRVHLEDASSVALAVEPAGEGKSRLVVTHERLSGGDAVERWRAFWKGAVVEIARLSESR